MLSKYLKKIKIALLLLITLIIITGFIYPLIVTGLSQLFFPWQANGSLITVNNKITGSALIGQSFTDKKYFWGRPSATIPFAYNAQNSSGSNLGPTNSNLISAIKLRINLLQVSDPANHSKIPIDLVTTSASGLDPDISPLSAYYQVNRIAKSRKISNDEVILLIKNSIVTRSFGIIGESRINVLKLNLALDQLQSTKRK
jgi:K+-transporting ATPase ATPase C chain